MWNNSIYRISFYPPYGEDIRKAAEEKFSRINVAYEKIKKQRGMN